MSITKNQLRTTVVLLTAGALAYFSFHQYRSHQKSALLSRHLVQLRVLRSSLAYFDESLTMSARLFVLTKDDMWKQRYRQHQQSFDSSLRAIRMLLRKHFEHQWQLESSAMNLATMQKEALALVDSDRTDEAKLILLGQEYDHRRSIHARELNRLGASLDQALARLVDMRDENARRNVALNAAAALLVLAGWVWYLRVAKSWYERINTANRKRAEAAVTAARQVAEANEQLRELTIYLQQSRERERLKIANEINEELGQRLASIKMQVNAIRKNIASGSASSGADQLKAISRQLGEAVESMTGFAHEIYPLVLRDLGIIEALQWVSDRMSREGGSVYFLSEEESVQLEQKVEVDLFRAYEERVLAAIEQGASEVIASLAVARGELVLTVLDNAPKSLIITDPMIGAAMQERIRSMKGRIESTYSAAEGNRFSVFVPIAASKSVVSS